MFISQPPFSGLSSNDRVNRNSFYHKNIFLQCSLNLVIEPLGLEIWKFTVRNKEHPTCSSNVARPFYKYYMFAVSR